MSDNATWAHVTVPVPVQLHVNMEGPYAIATELADADLYRAILAMVQVALDMGNAIPDGGKPQGAYLSIGELS